MEFWIGFWFFLSIAFAVVAILVLFLVLMELMACGMSGGLLEPVLARPATGIFVALMLLLVFTAKHKEHDAEREFLRELAATPKTWIVEAVGRERPTPEGMLFVIDAKLREIGKKSEDTDDGELLVLYGNAAGALEKVRKEIAGKIE